MLGRKIKKVITDFDGVVTDSNLAFAKEFTTIGNTLTGRNVSVQDIFDRWGESMHCLLQIFYPEISLEEYAKERVRLGFHLVTPPIFPGVLKALNQISRHCKLSILTNRKRNTLMADMGKLRIKPNLFERIQSRDDTFFAKPHPGVFNDFLVAYRADETLYVGDHIIDQQAAYGAGVHFVGVTCGGITTREDFLNAGVPRKMILNSLADVPARIGIYI